MGAHVRFEHKLERPAGSCSLRSAGVYNGQGESVNDNNNAKSFGVRGTVGIYRKLDVGGSWFSHDNIVTPTARRSGFQLQQRRLRRGRAVGQAGRCGALRWWPST